jgi:DNA-binding protein HU-beta
MRAKSKSIVVYLFLNAIFFTFHHAKVLKKSQICKKKSFFFVFSFVNQKFIVPLQPISVCAIKVQPFSIVENCITYIKNIIMTKAELVNAIAIKTGYDKTTIMNVVESAMDNIKNTVAAGETVYLRGFGSFGTKVRKQKVARNITKKESIIVPEHKIPAFKASDAFAEILK